MHENRCCVCGTLLYYTLTDRRQAAAYCVDRNCALYPPTTTSRAEDVTLLAFYTGMVDSTPVNATQVSRILGRNHNYVRRVVLEQHERWKDYN